MLTFSGSLLDVPDGRAELVRIPPISSVPNADINSASSFRACSSDSPSASFETTTSIPWARIAAIRVPFLVSSGFSRCSHARMPVPFPIFESVNIICSFHCQDGSFQAKSIAFVPKLANPEARRVTTGARTGSPDLREGTDHLSLGTGYILGVVRLKKG